MHAMQLRVVPSHVWGLRVLGAALLLQLAACEGYDSALLNGAFAVKSGALAELCGNGRRDEGERCDTAIDEGQPGACPSRCDESDDPCAPRLPAGADCQRECAVARIEKAADGDGCCPRGMGVTDDGDCGFCGDGIIGPRETCDPPESCATREQCERRDRCLAGVFSGDPEQCTARCELTVVRKCSDGDGCCPADCDASNDEDCSASCGDGVLQREVGETCESGKAALACAQTCDDGDVCTEDLVLGTERNCNVACVNAAITRPIDEDGCCPPGAHALNDSDCVPSCGNNVREGEETCDPCSRDCDDGDPCTRDTARGDPLACSLSCSHTRITTPAAGDACCPTGASAAEDSDCRPVCGNGITEPGEECDGGSLCDARCRRTDEARCQDADPTRVDSLCLQCRCSRCTDEMLGCFANPDPAFVRNCSAVVECGHDRHCTGSACFCGTSAFCARPNGLCRVEIAAAAAAAGQSVQACTDDPTCTLHQTTAIGACVEARCARECGQ